MNADFGCRLGFFQRILFGVKCCTALCCFAVIGRGLSFGSPMRGRRWLRVRGMQCQVLGQCAAGLRDGSFPECYARGASGQRQVPQTYP
jgi:hypothetical protein